MEEKSNSDRDSLSKGLSAASTLKSAAKTGKAVSSMVKGAAGGPYGMIAAGLWENRKLAVKILTVAASLFLLPVLFILMLPTLIFSGAGLNNVPNNVMNDNAAIIKNIAEAEIVIEGVLREEHDRLLETIQAEANGLGENCEYSIMDDFADEIIFESTLLISQFCSSQEDYKNINLAKLEETLRNSSNHLFSYRTDIREREEVINEETGGTRTITHYTYTVEYAGDAYFAGNVFYLTDAQIALSADYAANLQLFLFETVYQIIINPDLIPGETGNAAVDLALTKLGTPYSQSLRNQEGYFDCSSFTYWIYGNLGIQLIYDGANTASAQGRYITENNLAVSYDNLAPGDLIFYSFETNNRYMNIGHVAVYCGGGYVVDASSSRGKVVYRPIYDVNHIVLCGRPYSAP